jgi:arylsulfatase
MSGLPLGAQDVALSLRSTSRSGGPLTPQTGTPLGTDTATPVSDDYGPKESAFTGRIHWVQIDLGKDADDNDHLITPEERYRIAMTRQ